MRENFLNAIKNAKIINSVGQGVTVDALKILAIKYELTSEEYNALLNQLREENIQIMTVEEKLENERKHNPTVVNKGPKNKVNEHTKVVSNDEIINMAADVSAKTNLSEDEIQARVMLIKSEIPNHTRNNNSLEKAPSIVARALTSAGAQISREKLEKQGKSGWICGTYTGQVQKTLAKILKWKYTQERLKTIVDYCSNSCEDADGIAELTLIALVADIPFIIVHVAMSNLFD